MHTPFLATFAAQPAPPVIATPSGQVVAIAVPVVLILMIIYLCKHRKHKVTTAVLGFVTGALLANTTIGAALTQGVVEIITGLVAAISGIST